MMFYWVAGSADIWLLVCICLHSVMHISLSLSLHLVPSLLNVCLHIFHL